MKHTAYRLLAAISVLGALAAAAASTRPHYGGTLRVELQASAMPRVRQSAGNGASPGSSASDDVAAFAPWIFDSLVRLDTSGRIEPGLAVSWDHDPGGARWTFKLHSGVKWHDGSAFTAEQAAAALAGCVPGGRVTATSDAVEFALEAPFETLPMLLATSPACLARGAPLPESPQPPRGTGAFRLSEWQPGRRAVLQANDDYWDGRPYLDRLEVQLNRTSREALLDLELDRADVVELDPAEARRAQQENKTVWASAPTELLAIQFSPSGARADPRDLRQALSLSLDRAAIQRVLLQNFGEAAASLFPSWISGYAFLFPAQADLAQARKLTSDAGRTASWKLGYSSGDALTRVVAERVALNAREAGLQVQVVALSNGSAASGDAAYQTARGEVADARLVRFRILGPALERAAGEAAEQLGFPAPHDTQPAMIYEAESSFLDSGVVIPIAFVPKLIGLSSRVRNWSPKRWGALDLSEVWLAPVEP